jgi:hypothetical protein
MTSKKESRIPTRMIPSRRIRLTAKERPGRNIAGTPTVFAARRPSRIAIEMPEMGLGRPAGSSPCSRRTLAPSQRASNPARSMTTIARVRPETTSPTDEGALLADLELIVARRV